MQVPPEDRVVGMRIANINSLTERFGKTVLREALFMERLSAHPFVVGLHSAMVDKLARISEACEFESGEYLWKQGHHTQALHLVGSGRVALEIFIPHQGPLQIETVGTGDLIVCSWVVAPYRWHFDARALQNVSTVVVDGKSLHRQCDEDPILGYEVLKRLSHFQELRLQKARLRILELHSH
jgi:hypothetical protein